MIWFEIIWSDVKVGDRLAVIVAKNTVFDLRGQLVMLAARVAEIFEVETRLIVQNVKNNPDKFTERYAFELTLGEVESLTSSGMIAKPGRGGSRALPWVVTQKGAIRLATIMNAPKAIEAADIFVDVFTEVLTQVRAGKSTVRVTNPSRIAPDEDDQKEARKIRKKIVAVVNDILDTVVDTGRQTTVKDELGEIAVGIKSHYTAWLKSRQISNEKIEAETQLLLQQIDDLYERRHSDLRGAALDRERKALENIKEKILITKELMALHRALEPNAVVDFVSSFATPLALQATKTINGSRKNK